jgi:uncharacterized protein YodC (DUF2158 family)
MATFQPGDIVQLKSGGPLMTVRTITLEALCEWFNNTQELRMASFLPSSLQKHMEYHGGRDEE